MATVRYRAGTKEPNIELVVTSTLMDLVFCKKQYGMDLKNEEDIKLYSFLCGCNIPSQIKSAKIVEMDTNKVIINVELNHGICPFWEINRSR